MPRKKSTSEPAETPEVISAPVDSPARRRRSRAVTEASAPETPLIAVVETPAAAKPASRARRAPKTETAVITPDATVVSDDAPKPRSRRRTPVKTEAAAEVVVAAESDDLPVPVWRSRSGAPVPTPAVAPVDSADDEESDGAVFEVSEDDASLAIAFRKPTDTARKRTRRPAEPAAPAAESVPIAPAAFTDTFTVADEDEGIEIVVSMRPRSPGPIPTASDDEAPDTDSDHSGRGRRRRTRKSDTPESEPTPAEVSPSVAPEAKPEAKPEPVTFTIPSDAPQIILRNGVPTLVRNHRAYPPLFFCGNPVDDRRRQIVLDELRLAAEAGIHLHAFAITLAVDEDAVEMTADFARRLLQDAVAIDPEAQVYFRISFESPTGWQETYRNARYRNIEGAWADPSVSDDAYWQVARTCLERFVQSLRHGDRRNHVLGVHLDRGGWYLTAENGYDTSPAAEKGFQKWVTLRYNHDEVALRAAWFDGAVTFTSIEVPEYQPEGAEGEKFVRSSRRQRRYVDYHLFLSDESVRRIAELANTVKIASDGYFLVGVPYGYTFEWSHPGSAHLALGKLLRTEAVDIIAGPPSYRNRQPGGTGAFAAPIDSVALNGKLYVSEEDFKTSLGEGREYDDDTNPLLRTPQSLESVHWRGAGVALAHGSGASWTDSWGNGWLRTNSVWSRAQRLNSALIGRMEAPLGNPDVAIFIDERSLAYLVDPNAFHMLVQNVCESALRAGVNAAFYLLSDLAHREHFPDSRLYIFLNAWDIRPDLRAAIKSRLQGDNKVLFWLYTAGLFDSGRDALERAREVTGIAIKPQPFHSKAGTTLVNRRHPLAEAFPDRTLTGSAQLEPSYFAIPEGAMVLGEYSQSGLPSFVVKDVDEGPEGRWTSVFLGEPVVNPALIRALAQMAGCHVWSFHDDVVHVRPPYCTIHCGGSGPRTVAMPDKFSAFDLTNGHYADTGSIRFSAVEGATYSFVVGPKTDVDHLLNLDPAEVLAIEELPPRDANIRLDTSTFDVPIMKLGDWMGNTDNDEVADEWFLRPQPSLEEFQAEVAANGGEPERIGRRRRPRNNRNADRGPRGNGRVESHSAEDIEMSVMFRKRD